VCDLVALPAQDVKALINVHFRTIINIVIIEFYDLVETLSQQSPLPNSRTPGVAVVAWI
jgi:hypothetical protein